MSLKPVHGVEKPGFYYYVWGRNGDLIVTHPELKELFHEVKHIVIKPRLAALIAAYLIETGHFPELAVTRPDVLRIERGRVVIWYYYNVEPLVQALVKALRIQRPVKGAAVYDLGFAALICKPERCVLRPYEK